MEIKSSEKGGVTIIAISGKLDSNTAPAAQQEIMPRLDLGPVVLDASRLDYVSSAGLRMLLLAAKKLAMKNRKTILAGVSLEIQDIMKMTGFDHMFEFHSTLDSAATAAGKLCVNGSH